MVFLVICCVLSTGPFHPEASVSLGKFSGFFFFFLFCGPPRLILRSYFFILQFLFVFFPVLKKCFMFYETSASESCFSYHKLI